MIKLRHSLDDVVLVPFLVKGIYIDETCREGWYLLELPEDVEFDDPRFCDRYRLRLNEAALYDSRGYVIRKVEDK